MKRIVAFFSVRKERKIFCAAIFTVLVSSSSIVAKL